MADSGASSPFEAIRHTNDQGEEYWMARELADVLGYATSYRNFQPVIRKAITACEGSGYAVSDHFAHVRTMIETGKGAKRDVENWELSRYACYLVVQNADPEKPIVALGQTYFAVRTREAELTEQALLQGMSEDQLRLYVRAQLIDYNKQLAEAAQAAGVPSAGFATFQNHGYRGLYAGETAAMIAARKGVRPGQILDWMNADELAANLFRSSVTTQKLRNDPTIDTQAEANQTHYDVGKAVRQFIIEQGATTPELHPTPTHSIKEIQRQEQMRIAAERQPARQSALFPEDGESGSGGESDGTGEDIR
jgi:DNA-damage-inducible protein D